jgi:hypothetical protein
MQLIFIIVLLINSIYPISFSSITSKVQGLTNPIKDKIVQSFQEKIVKPVQKTIEPVQEKIVRSVQDKILPVQEKFSPIQEKIVKSIHEKIKPVQKKLNEIFPERVNMPISMRAIYDEFGDYPIQVLWVFRKPIQSGVKELIEITTKNERKKLNYDELFHTGFIVKCNDQLIRLERNHTIQTDAKITKDGGFVEKEIILPSGAISFRTFINRAMENDPEFWKYHPVERNCQLFVLQSLEKNDIFVSDELRAFIFQDAKEVLDNSPILKEFAIDVTSLANRIDNVVENINYLSIQNGTPYTLSVKTRYAGESSKLKTCLPDDLLIEPGRERNVSRGICPIDSLKVVATEKADKDGKKVPDEINKSFNFKDKVLSKFLIRIENGKFIVDNSRLDSPALQQLVAHSA